MYASLGLTREWTLANGHLWPGSPSGSPVLPEWEYPRTKAGYSIGLSLYRPVNQNHTLFLETGLGFTRKRYNTYTFLTSKPSFTVPPDPVSIIDTLITEVQLSVLQIPLLLQWRIGSNPDWKVTITSGIIPGAVMRHTNVDKSRTRNSSSSRDWLYSSMSFYFALGMYHPIGENHALLVEPLFALDFPANDRTFALKLTLIYDFFGKKK